MWLEGEINFSSVRLEMSWTLRFVATEPDGEINRCEGVSEYGLEVVE